MHAYDVEPEMQSIPPSLLNRGTIERARVTSLLCKMYEHIEGGETAEVVKDLVEIEARIDAFKYPENRGRSVSEFNDYLDLGLEAAHKRGFHRTISVINNYLLLGDAKLNERLYGLVIFAERSQSREFMQTLADYDSDLRVGKIGVNGRPETAAHLNMVYQDYMRTALRFALKNGNKPIMTVIISRGILPHSNVALNLGNERGMRTLLVSQMQRLQAKPGKLAL